MTIHQNWKQQSLTCEKKPTFNRKQDTHAWIDEVQIIQHYRSCYHFAKLCASYQKSYSKTKDTRLKTHHIQEEIENIIMQHFNIHLLPDPYFIYKDALLLSYSVKQEQKAVVCIENIVKRLIHMHKHSPKITLSYFKEQMAFDMKAFLVEMYMIYAMLQPDAEEVLNQELYIKQLLHIFSKDQEFSSDLQATILSCYGASANVDYIQIKCNALLEKYPQEPYFVYFSLLHGLAISKNISLIHRYYHQAIQYQPTTSLELTFQQQLILLYNASMETYKGEFS